MVGFFYDRNNDLYQKNLIIKKILNIGLINVCNKCVYILISCYL